MTRSSRRLAALAPFLLACSNADPGASPSPAASTDVAEYDVAQYRDGTIVVDPQTVALLQNPDATDGVYVFDPSATSIASLVPGQVAILSGFDLVKVESVDVQSGAITLKTSPASFVDAVTDGAMTWGTTIGYAQGTGDTNAQSRSPSLRLLDAPALAPLNFKGSLGPFSVDETFTPDANTGLTMSFLVSYQSGNALLKVAARGVLQPFRHEGDVHVRGGQLDSAYLKVEGLDLDLDVTLGAVALGKGDQTLALPVEIKVPYMVGPIPTYVSLAMTIDINPLLSDTSTSRGHAHFTVKGDAGLSYSNGSFSTWGSLADSSVSFDDYEAVSTVSSGLGVLLEAPRISMGVGPSIAGASAYMSLKTEAVANFAIQYDGAGLITGNCYTASVNFGAYAGGQMRLAGFKLKKEVPVFTKVDPLVTKGSACK
jgi:hypothetical protein